MVNDYTRSQADRLRAITVAGEIANLIRQIPQDVELPAISTPIGVSAAGSNTCGLSITFLDCSSFSVGQTSTGEASLDLKVCAGMPVTVTVTASFSPADSCITGSATGTWNNTQGSTETFTQGACDTLAIQFSYVSNSCTTIGSVGTLTLTFGNDLGCRYSMYIPVNFRGTDYYMIYSVTQYDGNGCCTDAFINIEFSTADIQFPFTFTWTGEPLWLFGAGETSLGPFDSSLSPMTLMLTGAQFNFFMKVFVGTNIQYTHDSCGATLKVTSTNGNCYAIACAQQAGV